MELELGELCDPQLRNGSSHYVTGLESLPRSKPLTLAMLGYLATVKTQRKAYISSTSPFDEKISVYLAKFNIAREPHVQLHHRVVFRLSCCTYG